MSVTNNLKYIHDRQSNLSATPSSSIAQHGWSPANATEVPLGRNANFIMRQCTLSNSFFKIVRVDLTNSSFTVTEAATTIGPLETPATNTSYGAESLLFHINGRANPFMTNEFFIMNNMPEGRAIHVFNSTPGKAVLLRLPPPLGRPTAIVRKILMPNQMVTLRKFPTLGLLAMEYDSNHMFGSPGLPANSPTPSDTEINHYYNGNSAVAQLTVEMSASSYTGTGMHNLISPTLNILYCDNIAPSSVLPIGKVNTTTVVSGNTNSFYHNFFRGLIGTPATITNEFPARGFRFSIGNGIGIPGTDDGLVGMRFKDPTIMNSGSHDTTSAKVHFNLTSEGNVWNTQNLTGNVRVGNWWGSNTGPYHWIHDVHVDSNICVMSAYSFNLNDTAYTLGIGKCIFDIKVSFPHIGNASSGASGLPGYF